MIRLFEGRWHSFSRLDYNPCSSPPSTLPANHADDPAADFRAAPGGGANAFELVAVRDLRAGDEITISYTGPAGQTNRRLMAQYGFVPAGGNAADRIELDMPEG